MTETAKEAANRLARTALSEGFAPEALHTYTNTDGTPLYWRIRAKHGDGRKWIRPMKLNGHGYELGEPDFEAGKPLYRLHDIASRPDEAVWIVEGEKPADALAKRGIVATTSGSATSADGADWSPLKGRACVIWRDNDEPGKAYAGEVAAQLLELGCDVSAIDVDRLELAASADAVDWLQSRSEASTSDLQTLPRLRAQPVDFGVSEPSLEAAWPAALDDAALHGIAGEVVRMVEPNTEADPAAILIQFLAAYGALVGRGDDGPYFRVEGDRHHANIFALMVGATSKGRKGTSWSRVREIFDRIQPLGPEGWKPHVSGLSSGEGLKYNVRDVREETKTNKNGEQVREIVDEGITDKRLLVVESEFASVLRAAQRQGNTLSATIREAWDSGDLRTLTKNDPVTATGAHICIIGHVTADELRAELTATDSANGFANRFLFVAVKRSKLLPFGGDQADEDEIAAVASRLRERMETARSRGRIQMTPRARTAWAAVYPDLSAGSDGLHGAVTGRAEAQAIRLALIYCLLDGAGEIDAPHLLAALAVWNYCDATAKQVFGDSLGDRAADEILRQLRRGGSDGLPRTEISNLFKRHLTGDRIGAALDLLRRRGLATYESMSTGGRPIELWRAAK
ncbi:MAG: hypothetical protein ACR2NO_03080 [Chloroflexota bacterium]